MGKMETGMKRPWGYALLAALASGCAALATGAAGAQQPAPASSSGRQPVQVNADRLEALRDEGRFIYTGNVEAVDGKSRMKADKLTVICDQPAQPPAKTKGEAANPSCSAIKELIAESNVYYFLDDDRIHGDRADYDYQAGTITITGSPVVLSRSDKGVISGPKLVYDTNKGVARMSGVNAGDRVSSVFDSSKDNNTSTPPSPGQPTPTPPAASPPVPH
jgi:lipopolysaccharide export system protein LptA